MSLQISILKVLAGQPDGRATVADLNRYITLLNVPEWTARVRRLSERAPDLDIFGSRYVLRDQAGWQLTQAGRAFLDALEMPAPATSDQHDAASAISVSEPIATAPPPCPPLRIVANNGRGRRRARRKDRINRSRVA
jgi:hypothetical protein